MSYRQFRSGNKTGNNKFDGVEKLIKNAYKDNCEDSPANIYTEMKVLAGEYKKMVAADPQVLEDLTVIANTEKVMPEFSAQD